MEYAAYLLYRVAVAFVQALPMRVDFALGRALGAVAYFVAPQYRKLVLRNMRIAFSGEKTEREIRRLAREHFATLGANLFSSIKAAGMSPEKIRERVTFKNLETLNNGLLSGNGVVLMISHIGNWELFAQLTWILPPGSKSSTVYQPLGNRYIDEHVRQTRARAGVMPFARKDGFNAPIRFLREGGLVGVLIDQHAGDSGIWAPFFGRLASTSSLAATLALRTGAEIVPVAIYIDGFAHWRFVVSEPIPHENISSEQLTATMNRVLEAQIRVSPRDWFWVHERWKTPDPKFLLATYKRGVVFPQAQSLKPFRILIRSTNWLGDAVMSTPAVRAIKRGRPDAHVTVLSRAKLVDFWKTVEVDEVIAIQPNESVFSVARKIRREFDVAIVFPNSVRAALEVFLARIPRRVGYRARWRDWFLNQTLSEKTGAHPPRHEVHHYFNLAEFIGAQIQPKKSIGSQSINGNKIGLCPGAEYGPAKRWLPERFTEVAKRVSEKMECEWLLFGVEKDREIGEQISVALAGKCTNLIGKTSLAELIEKLRECRVLLTNDTGTMHLAAHLGVPTVAIFGSTEPALTGPLGAHNRVIRHHVECSPCFLRECPLDFRCMNAVTVDEVTDAVLAALR